MIKYFKELEKPDNQSIMLYTRSIYNYRKYWFNTVPSSFFDKYLDTILAIDKVDMFYDKDEKDYKVYTWETDAFHTDYECPYPTDFTLDCLLDTERIMCPRDIDELFNSYTIDAVIKIAKLINEYMENNFESMIFYDKKRFYEAVQYLDALLVMFEAHKHIISTSRDCLDYYLSNAKVLLKGQGRLSNEDEKTLKEMINYLRSLYIDVYYGKEITDYKLPNAWYITPFNHLYNCMGALGHGESNLDYPRYLAFKGKTEDGSPLIAEYRTYLCDVEKIEKDGYITKAQFDHYLHLGEYAKLFRDEDYYRVDHSKPSVDDYLYDRYYSRGHVKLTLGIISAHAGFWRFFRYLYFNSADYMADLNSLRGLSTDDILVRCCGFHKISSVCDKMITTSCINYEEKFAEYIAKGWRIDFVKPLVLNPISKRLCEYDNDLLLVRKMHKMGDE